MPDTNILTPAWIPAASALGGVLVGLLSPWLTSFAIAKREREGRREARRDVARERQNAFQRETLLSLQESAETLIRASERLAIFNSKAKLQSGSWIFQGYPKSLTALSGHAFLQVAKLKVRITDDFIRRICTELQEQYTDSINPVSEEGQSFSVNRLFDDYDRLNAAIGERLRTLDDESVLL